MQYRMSGDNFQISCPLCTDKTFRLGIHKDTGNMRCFNCNFKVGAGSLEKNVNALSKAINKITKGNIQTYKTVDDRKKEKPVELAKDVEKIYHKRLKAKNRKANRYLQKGRGFKPVTIKFFKLGSKKYKAGNNSFEYVALPYMEDGRCVNLKYRAISKDVDKSFKWIREKGCKSILFNGDVLNDHKYDEVYLCESEIDTMSLWNQGFKNAVGLTTGAQSFKQEWYDRLERFDKIYLVLDSDEAGQSGARALANRLGVDRCFNVTLPDGVKDPNAFFWNEEKEKANYTKKDFIEYIKKAKPFDVEGITHCDDMFDAAVADLEEKGADQFTSKTPWSNVNDLCGGGFSEGNLVVVAAKAKAGKTTLCINQIIHHAKNHGTVGMYSCEMNAKMLAKNFVRMANPEYIDATSITKAMLRSTQRRLPTHNMKFFYPKIGDFSLEQVKENITNSVRRYGIKLFVFDNLLFLAREVKEYNDIRDKVGKITQTFKLLAESLGITIVLITHPRKVAHDNPLSEDDLKESSSIFQDLDVLILMHRKKIKEDDEKASMPPTLTDRVDQKLYKKYALNNTTKVYENLTHIKVVSRYAAGGTCYLWFNDFTGIFYSDGNDYRAAMKVYLQSKKKKGKK